MLIAVAVAFLVMGAAAIFGRWAGESVADEVSGRLSLLWPDVMAMPQQDRTLLALLAYECRLPDQPKGRSSTIACLRSATGAENIKKISPDPSAHLDKLLDQAKPIPTRGDQG